MRKYWENARLFAWWAWSLFICQIKGHDMSAIAEWSPEVIYMHIVCGRCGKIFGRIDISQCNAPRKKELLH